MNNIGGSTGRWLSGKDDSYPAAADDSACSTTSMASPKRQCDRCRASRRSGGLGCPGPSLWKDPAAGEGTCAGHIHSRYVGVHRRDVFVGVGFELAAYPPTAGERC